MTTSSKIQKIIDKRRGEGEYANHGHITTIKEKLDFFTTLKKDIESFSTFRDMVLRQIECQNGEYYQMSIKDPSFEARISNCSPKQILDDIDNCIDECHRLYERFSRDSINISVIGRAGQGKSTLLQALSGLDNKIIPSAAGGDCTGAKSIICNSGEETWANIVFYTEKEVICHIQKYLDAIGVEYMLDNISQVPKLKLDEISKQMRTTQSAKSQFKHLEKYVKHYEEYKEYIGASPKPVKENEIRSYVAQYEDDGRDTYKYLIVKEAKIFTKFPYSEAGKIMLVDTIGLGDTSIGIRDKMMDVLINDSDAAISLRRPDPLRDGIREEDNEFYDFISQKATGRALDKWLFNVLNVSDKLNNISTGKIIEDELKEQMPNGCFITQLDCSDANAVQEQLLIPILNSLMQNLESIDNELLKGANEQFNTTFLDFISLSGNIQKVINGSLKSAGNLGGEFDDAYGSFELFDNLKKLQDKYYETKDVPNELILAEIKKILKNISQYCPESEDIIRRMRHGVQDSYFSNVYNYYADYVRSKVYEEFETITASTITSLQNDVKKEIAMVLYAQDGGNLGAIPLSSSYEKDDILSWMEAFSSEKLSNYPEIKDSFSFILSYRLNIEGLMEYKVNKSLEFLDPSSKEFTFIDFHNMNEEEASEAIEQNLLNCITKIGRHLSESVNELLNIPNSSFYARIRKFREKLIFLDSGKKELKNFYRDNCTLIWKERFTNIIGVQTALGDWNKYSNFFSEKCIKESFIIIL